MRSLYGDLRYQKTVTQIGKPTAVGVGRLFIWVAISYIYLVVVVNSDEQYCHSFLDKLAAAAMDAAEEGYIEITKKFVSSPMPPYIYDHQVIIRFRDYSISVSCLDDGKAEVKIQMGNDIDRYILNTKQEMEQFQKDLLTLIDMIRHSAKIGGFMTKKKHQYTENLRRKALHV
jgi:hypothetical protein